MKRQFGTLLASLLGLAGLRADLSADAWHNEPLGTAAANNNEWYSFPDVSANPRVLVKVTGAAAGSNAARRFLTGGPPSWTTGTSANIALSKQGVFVPGSGGTGYLVAPHNNLLRLAIFQNDGSVAFETVDTNAGTYTGISAEFDSDNKLHVGYIYGGNTLCYARRNGPNSWNFTSLAVSGTAIHQTAVVPITFSSVNLYYTMTAFNAALGINITTLWHAKPGVHPGTGTLMIAWGASPSSPLGNAIDDVESFVAPSLRGSRVGATGRVYYFGGGNTTSWSFKRYAGSGDPTALEAAGFVSPKNIQVAFGPDGRQRVAWYESNSTATAGRIHYLKPPAAGPDLPVLAGFPVLTTGAQLNADLLGFHFGADGTPYLLYRTTLAAGFVAFPNDNFDFNGNGRPDLLDNAFNSTVKGLETLPVVPAAAGVANSANRFKFSFPTIGSATSNGLSAVTSTQENLRYGIELSPDLANWTPATTTGVISFTTTAESGTSPNQLRTMTGVVNSPAPGALPARFARMVVTRSSYPY